MIALCCPKFLARLIPFTFGCLSESASIAFQLEYQAAQYYPQFYRGIYLAGLRYNLHLRPRALLLEAGAQTNTVEEVRNAMEPFADILNRVLKGSDKEG